MNSPTLNSISVEGNPMLEIVTFDTILGEMIEVETRWTKLSLYIMSKAFIELDEISKDFVETQEKHMAGYLGMLKERLKWMPALSGEEMSK